MLNKFNGSDAFEIGSYDKLAEKRTGVLKTAVNVGEPVVFDGTDTRNFIPLTKATEFPIFYTMLHSGWSSEGKLDTGVEIYVMERVEGLRVRLAPEVTTLVAGNPVFWDPAKKVHTNDKGVTGALAVGNAIFTGAILEDVQLGSGYTGKVGLISFDAMAFVPAPVAP